ncbi:MAG: hypothetical protein ACREAK_09985 [Nitrosarchaeum sp.]
MLILFNALWGCIPEIASDCLDMTNSSSTYLSLVIGGLVGGGVSWLIYDRQKKISEKQDITIQHTEKLNENHSRMLKRIEQIEQAHQETLDAILELNKKMELAQEHNEKSASNEVEDKI